MKHNVKCYYDNGKLLNGEKIYVYIRVDWDTRICHRIDIYSKINRSSGFVSKTENHDHVLSLGYKETTEDVFNQMYEL